MKRFLPYLLALLALIASASAQTLTGTVSNGTTKKPASGDDVVLIKLSQGMEEAARTKADSQGNFTFKLDDNGPHLVRAIHQGVTYHKMAPPGTASVDLQVFDVSKKLAGISVTADVMRVQAQGNELQGIRLFAVDNHSDPPRTQMNDQNFEFYLPDGASVDQSMAMTAGGQPINSAPVPQKEKNRYAYVFPLRPGETQFQVSFHMPYSGQLSVDPKALYGDQHFVVMLPKSMQFSAGAGTSFQSMKDPRQSDALVQVASNTRVGQPLAFTISGTGVLTDESQEASAGQAGGQGQVAGRDSRPIHSRNIAGTFSAALAWCSLQARSTLPSGLAARLRSSLRRMRTRLRRQEPTPVVLLYCLKRLKKRSSNSKLTASRAISHNKSMKQLKRRSTRPWSGRSNGRHRNQRSKSRSPYLHATAAVRT